MNNFIIKPYPLLSEMNPMFDLWQSFHQDVRTSDQSWQPTVDIKETAKAFTLEVDLPGLSPQEVDISMDDNVLILKGERQFEENGKDDNINHSKQTKRHFHRAFTLPKTIDSQQISACSRHGVLEVTLPKKEKISPKRIHITVDAA